MSWTRQDECRAADEPTDGDASRHGLHQPEKQASGPPAISSCARPTHCGKGELLAEHRYLRREYLVFGHYANLAITALPLATGSFRASCLRLPVGRHGSQRPKRTARRHEPERFWAPDAHGIRANSRLQAADSFVQRGRAWVRAWLRRAVLRRAHQRQGASWRSGPGRPRFHVKMRAAKFPMRWAMDVCRGQMGFCGLPSVAETGICKAKCVCSSPTLIFVLRFQSEAGLRASSSQFRMDL